MSKEWDEEEFLSTYKEHLGLAIELGCRRDVLVNGLINERWCPFFDVRASWNVDSEFRRAAILFIRHRDKELVEKMLKILDEVWRV